MSSLGRLNIYLIFGVAILALHADIHLYAVAVITIGVPDVKEYWLDCIMKSGEYHPQELKYHIFFSIIGEQRD